MATAHAGGLDAKAQLERAGLPSQIVADWLASRPDLTGDYERDAAASARNHQARGDEAGRSR